MKDQSNLGDPTGNDNLSLYMYALFLRGRAILLAYPKSECDHLMGLGLGLGPEMI